MRFLNFFERQKEGIDVSVKQLRAMLEPVPMEPGLIITKRKRTVEELHMRIVLLCVSLTKMAESYAYEDMQGQKARLERLGLTSSSNYKELLRREKLDKKVKVINLYKRLFPDSLLIELDDFKNLVKEYGLVCGTLDRYKGSVPYKNLIEIENAVDVLSRNAINYDYIPNKGIFFFEHIFSNNTDVSEYRYLPFGGIGNKTNVTIVAEDYFNSFSDYNHAKGNGKNLNASDLLIAATADMMDGVRVHEIESLVKDDPIIFQFLPMDLVIIYSKWGAESDAVDNYKDKLL